ncbi:MAG: hypothetical protein ACXWT3_14820 [Methylococcaceae bacterium]
MSTRQIAEENINIPYDKANKNDAEAICEIEQIIDRPTLITNYTKHN